MDAFRESSSASVPECHSREKGSLDPNPVLRERFLTFLKRVQDATFLRKGTVQIIFEEGNLLEVWTAYMNQGATSTATRSCIKEEDRHRLVKVDCSLAGKAEDLLGVLKTSVNDAVLSTGAEFGTEEGRRSRKFSQGPLLKLVTSGRLKPQGNLGVMKAFFIAMRASRERIPSIVAKDGAIESSSSGDSSVRRTMRSPSLTPSLQSTANWVPDASVTHCPICRTEFGWFTRKHHCRVCGNIYCKDCSSSKVNGERSCDSCFKEWVACVQRESQAQEEAKEFVGVAENPQRGAPLVSFYSDGILQTKLKERMAKISCADNLSLSKEKKTLETKTDESKFGQMGPEPSEDVPLLLKVTKDLEEAVIGLQGEVEQLKGDIERSRETSVFTIFQNTVMWCILFVTGFDAATLYFFNVHAFLSVPILPSQDQRHYEKGASLVLEKAYGMVNISPQVFIALRTTLSEYWCQILEGLLGISFLIYIIWFKLLTKLFKRRIAVFFLAVRVIGFYTYLKYWEDYCKPEVEHSEHYWNECHTFYARTVCKEVIRLRGFWVKVGQYLSSRADVMPKEWISELTKVQDHMPHAAYEDVVQIIEDELGQRVDNIFLCIDKTPIASASIAQVHKAKLKGEKDVAIKIQHSGIQEIMKQDLTNLRTIMWWVAFINSEFDFRPVVDEWSREAIKELDFNNELCNMMEVSANMISSRLPIRVPTAYPQFCSKKILVMEYINGFKVTDIEFMEQHNVDKAALIKCICEAYAYQIYVNGIFNGDPHPGNIMVSLENGKVTPWLLDFGLTKRLSEKMKIAFANMIFSAEQNDFGGLVCAFEMMNLKLRRQDPLEDMKNIRFLFRDSTDRDTSRRHIREHWAQMRESRREKSLPIRNPVDSWPCELVFYVRVMALLRGLCASMEVSIPFLKVFSPYAELSMLNIYPLEQHAFHVVYPSESLSLFEAKLKNFLLKLSSDSDFLGLQVCIYKDGRKVADAAAGVMGTGDPRPVTSSTLFNCFSATKALSAMCIHLLADKGKLRYSDEVRSFWPEFGVNGKEHITVDHVLSHTAGLHGAVGLDCMFSDVGDWNAMLKKIEQATPAFAPGSKVVYHYLSFGWLVGAIVEKVSGESFVNFFRKNIVEPLDVENEMFIGTPNREHGRIATLAKSINTDSLAQAMGSSAVIQDTLQQYYPGSIGSDGDLRTLSTLLPIMDPLIFNVKSVRQAVIPSANAHTSARALAAFYNRLCGGTKLVSEQTMELVGTITAIEQRGNVKVVWGRGLAIYIPDGEHNGGSLPCVGTMPPPSSSLGHTGFGGSLGFCNRDRKFALAIMTNKLTLDKSIVKELVSFSCANLGVPVPSEFH
eukprot:Nk52_evm2s2367 gene=Nk52_evmTU2s2367